MTNFSWRHIPTKSNLITVFDLLFFQLKLSFSLHDSKNYSELKPPDCQYDTIGYKTSTCDATGHNKMESVLTCEQYDMISHIKECKSTKYPATLYGANKYSEIEPTPAYDSTSHKKITKWKMAKKCSTQAPIATPYIANDIYSPAYYEHYNSISHVKVSGKTKIIRPGPDNYSHMERERKYDTTSHKKDHVKKDKKENSGVAGSSVPYDPNNYSHLALTPSDVATTRTPT